MKIKLSSGGVIKMTAQSKGDSIALLELLEGMSGRGNDPERQSLKQRAEHEEQLAKEAAESDHRRAAYKNALFINQGSVWDINIHLKNSGSKYSLKQLYEEVERERITRNRITVIKNIMAIITKMEREIQNAAV